MADSIIGLAKPTGHRGILLTVPPQSESILMTGKPMKSYRIHQSKFWSRSCDQGIESAGSFRWRCISSMNASSSMLSECSTSPIASSNGLRMARRSASGSWIAVAKMFEIAVTQRHLRAKKLRRTTIVLCQNLNCPIGNFKLTSQIVFVRNCSISWEFFSHRVHR